MAQRSVPAPFLTKTYQLVEDPETNDVVSWNDNGTSFVVWKTADFARDLLPKYFKHNNFSSFVRQLNTYGFRKVVPDKWEFANDDFRRAQKELLSAIRRRKTATAASDQAEKPAGGGGGEGSATPSGSAGTTSPSSPESKSAGSAETAAASAQLAELSGENEKLKKDNEVLSSELAQMKRQCDELIGFLTEYVKVGPDQIDRVMRAMDGCDGSGAGGGDRDDEDGEKEEEKKEGVKLFGVWVNKKRKICAGGDHQKGFSGGTHSKEINGLDFLVMKISGKVCN